MITKLTEKEKEQLFHQSKYASARSLIRQSSPSWANIEWYKQVIPPTHPYAIEKITHQIGNEHVMIYAVHITPFTDSETVNLVAIRAPLFILNRSQRPRYKVVFTNVSTACQSEVNSESLNGAVNRYHAIPEFGNSHYQQLSESGCLGTLFQDHITIIFPGEVGVDIPFFKGTKRLHRECLKHGKIPYEKPIPKKLLDGAQWYSTELQPL